MKRKIIAIVLSLALCFSFTACGGDNKSEEASSETTAATKETKAPVTVGTVSNLTYEVKADYKKLSAKESKKQAKKEELDSSYKDLAYYISDDGDKKSRICVTYIKLAGDVGKPGTYTKTVGGKSLGLHKVCGVKGEMVKLKSKGFFDSAFFFAKDKKMYMFEVVSTEPNPENIIEDMLKTIKKK
ncbi:MAG: hypothetical protein RSA73_05135 [Anaerovoracaceae bacterium]